MINEGCSRITSAAFPSEKSYSSSNKEDVKGKMQGLCHIALVIGELWMYANDCDKLLLIRT